ncbi:MAG TPA: DEAD/DEAH box helicase [Pseudomonadales bacterium]|nr:DEAD/DEAH box helicase [Pseudomonadales bacterium]
METPNFESLALDARLLKAIDTLGYEKPSPIQAACIPPMLEGRDLLGQAQTGTGKTAAFALPTLSMIDLSLKEPQVLVLAPTRELAIQVAEAFQAYAKFLPGFHVLPIYGGQSFDTQFRGLKRGPQVIVGTPGRVMDHMRRKSLVLDSLRCLVLDEADEMLRMGFIDDVEWVLEQTPDEHQTALFSATMPKQIRSVAERYLDNPQVVKIESKTTTATTIRQRYWNVSGMHKLDALTRILEIEEFEAVLIFVRTKTSTVELSEKLQARGYAAEALHGDMSQQMRERVVERLKAGKLDIVIGTDVVARGLDVERISHVVNFDIPYDTESYVHRIGRTGRAGRSGDAILFVAPRERRMLNAIERATGQPIEAMNMPTVGDINEKRVERFKQKIVDTIATADLDLFYKILKDLQMEHDLQPINIAAALAALNTGSSPLLLSEQDRPRREREERSGRGEREERGGRGEREERGGRGERDGRSERRVRGNDKEGDESVEEFDSERFRVEVGRRDGVKPGNLVGAIANEAGISSRFIGSIEIYDDYTTVDLPAGMPKEVMATLQRAIVCNKPLAMTRVGKGGKVGGPPRSKPKKGSTANRKAAKANKEREGFAPKKDRDSFAPKKDREGFAPKKDRDGSAPKKDRKPKK